MCISNNQLPKQVNNFLNYLSTIKGKSINTINGYKMDLNLFFKFMKSYKNNQDIELDNTDISDIDIAFIKSISLTDMYTFMNYLETERENTANSRKRKISSLKSFYDYLQTKEETITKKENPTLRLEMPKVDEKDPIYLTLDECKRLLSAVEDENGYYFYERDYCIITLFLHCGVRLSELRNLDLQDIKEDKLFIKKGKGSKDRQINLDTKCVKAVKQWLNVRQSRDVNANDKDALFISKKYNRISKSSIEDVVDKYVKKAGLDENITPHKLRHTFATLMLSRGVDLITIKETMGHSSVSTTQIYTHVSSEDQKIAMEKNPLNML